MDAQAQLLGDEKQQPISLSVGDTITVLLGTAFVACLAMMLLSVAAWGLIGLYSSPWRPPAYSVTMDGFSGLEVEDDLPRAFNLTLGIDNLGGSGTVEVCVGGEAVVLYKGVPLAGGHVEDLCVPRKRAANLNIFTASGGVGLPGVLAELMASEKRAEGVVRVEVRVVMPKHARLLPCTAPLDEEGPARPYPCRVAGLVDESDGVRPDGSGTVPAPV
ncbi:hypothetical protein QOZ80_4AG0310650 [Eleusine coracana subsp. coracana]|nr:hypothetical protein QOZ80_4AG0310650 [Eleusine coracana subsp. coracana]